MSRYSQPRSTMLFFSWLLFAVWTMTATTTSALQPVTTTTTSTRRQWLVRSILIGTATVGLQPNEARASAYCSSGVGDGCDELSQGNALIRELQEKSAQNKDKYERETREAYYMKNYPDWFQSVGQTLVKREEDGTFVSLSDQQVEEYKRANRLTIEVPKTMGGKFVDLTQKPILVLKK